VPLYLAPPPGRQVMGLTGLTGVGPYRGVIGFRQNDGERGRIPRAPHLGGHRVPELTEIDRNAQLTAMLN
jgi:hypothetical protein